MNSESPRQQMKFDLVGITPIKSLSMNLVRVVQFNVRRGFRTEADPQKPHMPTPKLALVDAFLTPLATVWNG